MDSKLGQFSTRLWPYNMGLLCMLGVATTLLDYQTTYHMLVLSSNPIIEGNPVVRALLEIGGWRLLFIKDLIVPGLYAVAAYVIYRVAYMQGSAGTGRFLSVVLFQIYLWARLIPAINNALLAYL